LKTRKSGLWQRFNLFQKYVNIVNHCIISLEVDLE